MSANGEDANKTFLKLIDSLLDSYSPKGVLIWLMSENKRFDGESPRDLVDRGDWKRLLDEANRLAGGPR